MSLVINHNMMAANTARNLNAHYGRLATSTQRLSSGLRINSAADDAAGLAIRELQRADIAALHQGARNANDAVSMIQVADGSLSIIDEKLIRMKELAEQAATGTYDSTQRLMIESEYQAMASEITRIANATDFNGIKLLDGTLAGEHDGSGLTAKGEMKIHFGTGNDSAEDYYYVQIGSVTASSLGVGNSAFDITRPDPWELIDQTTLEYYEKLRDESAQVAWTNTYTEKYTEFQKSIYNNIVAGTSLNPAIEHPEIHEQADAQARELATKYADHDSKMVKATFDKIFDDAWNEPYLEAYKKNIDAGMSLEQAHEEAAKIANETAIKEVKAKAETVAQDNNLDSIADLMPPKNHEGAKAFAVQVGVEARQVIYKLVYDELYRTAYEEAFNQQGDLRGDQIIEIYKQCDAIAKDKADILGQQIENAILGEYDSGYGDAFQKAYNEALADGNPTAIAENLAHKAAGETGWENMEEAARSGNRFGLFPPSSTASVEEGRILHFQQLQTGNRDIYVPGLGIVTASTNDRFKNQASVNDIYKSISVESIKYLDDNHTMVRPDSMVKASESFTTQYDADAEYNQEAIKHNEKLERGEYDVRILRDGGTVSTQAAAQRAIVAINNAIVSKDKIRAHLGAVQNRLENTISNLNIMAENLQAAESRISDVDIATEMTNMVRNQILSQAATAMLAQANSLPQMAMQLIGG